MQSLVVQALAMRQLGRLSPRHLLAAGYALGQSEWCPRAIHTRQLWGCAAFPTHCCHRAAGRGRDTARGWPAHPLRFRSNKKKEAARAAQEKEDDDDEEEDPEDSDYEDEVDENPNLPKDYKDMEKFVQSLRYDVMMKAGLDIARNKIEDAFYKNKLMLNGQKLIKKSKSVKVGDVLDVVLSENKDTNTVTVMRVIPRKLFPDLSAAEKHKVAIRRWKNLQLPRDEVFKP